MNQQRLDEAEQFWTKLHKLNRDTRVTNTFKARSAAAAFCIAADHHASVLILMRSELYSSAFALCRVVFEALLRGIWLKTVATEETAQSVVIDHAAPPPDMISSIEKMPGYTGEILRQLKRKHYSSMSDFTHTGGLHISHWLAGNTIQPNFSNDELDGLLNDIEVLSANAALQLAQLREFGDDGASVLHEMKVRWPNPIQPVV